MRSYFSLVLALQLAYCALCIAWNATGLWQIGQGLQSIGPTASLSAITVLGLLSAMLVYSYYFKKPGVFLAASLVIFVLAALAIWGGFSKAPDSWSSEFWRYAGIALNTWGVLTFVFALRAFLAFRQSLHS